MNIQVIIKKYENGITLFNGDDVHVMKLVDNHRVQRLMELLLPVTKDKVRDAHRSVNVNELVNIIDRE